MVYGFESISVHMPSPTPFPYEWPLIVQIKSWRNDGA